VHGRDIRDDGILNRSLMSALTRTAARTSTTSSCAIERAEIHPSGQKIYAFGSFLDDLHLPAPHLGFRRM